QPLRLGDRLGALGQRGQRRGERPRRARGGEGRAGGQRGGGGQEGAAAHGAGSSTVQACASQGAAVRFRVLSASSMGMKKLMPTGAPLTIWPEAVRPITCPASSSSGPPEDPWFTITSLWM